MYGWKFDDESFVPQSHHDVCAHKVYNAWVSNTVIIIIIKEVKELGSKRRKFDTQPTDKNEMAKLVESNCEEEEKNDDKHLIA